MKGGSYKEQSRCYHAPAVDVDASVAQVLLAHVNYRVSDSLKAAYPNARRERFSQDIESYDRTSKLEEIGYSVMTMSPGLFRRINQVSVSRN